MTEFWILIALYAVLYIAAVIWQLGYVFAFEEYYNRRIPWLGNPFPWGFVGLTIVGTLFGIIPAVIATFIMLRPYGWHWYRGNFK